MSGLKIADVLCLDCGRKTALRIVRISCVVICQCIAIIKDPFGLTLRHIEVISLNPLYSLAVLHLWGKNHVLFCLCI